jgi:hypothetical protein
MMNVIGIKGGAAIPAETHAGSLPALPLGNRKKLPPQMYLLRLPSRIGGDPLPKPGRNHRQFGGCRHHTRRSRSFRGFQKNARFRKIFRPNAGFYNIGRIRRKRRTGLSALIKLWRTFRPPQLYTASIPCAFWCWPRSGQPIINAVILKRKNAVCLPALPRRLPGLYPTP